MITKETVYTVYCDGCRKLLDDKHPILGSHKEFQKHEEHAQFAVERNGWMTEKINWKVFHYCPECQNTIEQLKAKGKYNPYDGYSKKEKLW